MFDCFQRSRNVILGDEMGLGKTAQSLSFLECLWRFGGAKGRGPHLVIVPKSTLKNWEAEAAVWVPHMSWVSYDGSKESRRRIRTLEFYSTNEQTGRMDDRGKPRVKCDMIFTSYDLVARDSQFFHALQTASKGGESGHASFGCLVVDEGHRLKSLSVRVHCAGGAGVALADVPRRDGVPSEQALRSAHPPAVPFQAAPDRHAATKPPA